MKIVVKTDYNHNVIAYQIVPWLLLIQAGKVRDSDDSIVTDQDGFRYRRQVRAGQSRFFEYWRR